MRVQISPDDAGERVSVRAAEPDGGMRDVLGRLLRWEQGVLEIERKDGSVARIDQRRLVAAKRLGPPPQRRQPPG